MGWWWVAPAGRLGEPSLPEDHGLLLLLLPGDGFLAKGGIGDLIDPCLRGGFVLTPQVEGKGNADLILLGWWKGGGIGGEP